MDERKIKLLAEELAKDIKSEADLSKLTQIFVKATVEKALGVEMESHLGYSKHSSLGKRSGNSRNGYSQKTLRTDNGEVLVSTPRDRNGTFEPEIVRKGQTRLKSFDDKILSLYAKGMTTRDIVETFKEMYDADISATLVSKVTEAVIEDVIAWQNRSLESIYPVVYLDCIVVKIHQDKRVINKAIYLALGINLEGHKELLGMWISENEGAKFWLSVLTELQNRGLKDIFICCVDGLSGFPEAIQTVYPNAAIQLCIVHMVRNSLKYVTFKDRKPVAADLKKIYRSISADEAIIELEAFEKAWNKKYPSIAKSWRRNWDNIITLFDYPDEIRKIIYTTNAIESLNSVLRKAIKNRKIFPNDNSAFKVLYLAIKQASKKWTMPIRAWKPAVNRFIIEYEERIKV